MNYNSVTMAEILTINTITRRQFMKNMKDESNIKFGDVPGDIVSIGKEVRHNAEVIFPKMLQLLPGVMERNPYKRAVITVCGGYDCTLIWISFHNSRE